MKQALRNLITDGKTAIAITELLRLNIDDNDLQMQINLLSARLTVYENEKNQGIADERAAKIELNRINAALLAIIDRLDDTQLPPSVPERLKSANDVAETLKIPPTVAPKWLKFDNIKSIIAVLAGLVGILTFVFKFCLSPKEGNDGKPFPVTVFTHGIGGRQDIVQFKETNLVIDLKDDRRIADIGKNGQNTFNGIPNTLFNQKIGIGLKGTEGYVLKYPDSIYVLNNEPIYLAVQSSCRFCKIAGVVRNQKAFIANAVVSTGRFSDTTDVHGYFEINLPPTMEQSEYGVTVRLNNKIVWDKFITPDSKKNAEILIQ